MPKENSRNHRSGDTQTVSIQLQYRQARSRIVINSPALFPNSSRQRLSTQGIANIISQFRKDARIERNITPHMLRHTVATLLLRNGVDIRVVQEFLGHASTATQRYTHVAKEHLIGVLPKSHPSLGLRMKALTEIKLSTLFETHERRSFDPAKTHRARNSTRHGNWFSDSIVVRLRSA